MPDYPHEIRIRIEDFDRNQLDPDQQKLEGEELRLAIRNHFEEEFQAGLGVAEIIVTEEVIILRWKSGESPASLSEQAVTFLSGGDYKRGIALLEIALKANPEDEVSLYNLGMALSDQGQLDEAESHLRHLVERSPDHARGWVALGVALARKRDLEGAVNALRRAVKCDPDDGYAQKNLGALLIESSDCLEEAAVHLARAKEILPDDQQVWLNLGKLCEKREDLDAADEAYLKVLDINSMNQLADMAKEGRSRISEAVFRERGGGARPDAMMYCLGALQKFDGKPRSEVQKITFEIATLGMGGLDVNDPAEKYSIRSLSGKFSGLHLLCIEYVGFNMLDPNVDLGFDLSKELEEAKKLHSGS